MRGIKCKVCGKRFVPKAQDRYLCEENVPVLVRLTKAPMVFECFDCPRCGCQCVANIREVNQEAEDVQEEEEEETDVYTCSAE